MFEEGSDEIAFEAVGAGEGRDIFILQMGQTSACADPKRAVAVREEGADEVVGQTVGGGAVVGPVDVRLSRIGRFAVVGHADIRVFEILGVAVTEGDVALFCGVTGDYNPYHIDQTFVESSWFGRRIIPGLLTSSMITHIGGMIGFLATEMHFYYVAPVYIGDTITCTVTFQEKDEEKRLMQATASCVNQDGVEVLQARFSGFPAQVRLV